MTRSSALKLAAAVLAIAVVACSDTTAPSVNCKGSLEVDIHTTKFGSDTAVSCVFPPPDTVYTPPDTIFTPPDTIYTPPDTVYLPPDTTGTGRCHPAHPRHPHDKDCS